MEKELFKSNEKTYNLMVNLAKRIKEKGKLIDEQLIRSLEKTSMGDTIQTWQYGKHIYKLLYVDNLNATNRAKILHKIIKVVEFPCHGKGLKKRHTHEDYIDDC
jgi:hypothetical protein